MAAKRKYTKKKGNDGLEGTTTNHALHLRSKESAIETGKDILIGVIGGGITGMLLGKSSLLIGAGVTGYGHFENKPFMRTFGMGMMMGGGMDAAKQAMSGLTAEDIQAKVVSFKDGFLSKLYLDKVFKKTESANQKTVNGLGEGDIDLSTLTKFEQQILQHGTDLQKKKDAENEVNGNEDNLNNTDDDNLNSSYAELVDDLPVRY
jgi:hypothetical protein